MCLGAEVVAVERGDGKHHAARGFGVEAKRVIAVVVELQRCLAQAVFDFAL
jgi:hypothetical protein